jgi:hypothetical protein
LRGGDIGFGQDALFVLGRESAALAVGDDLRISAVAGRAARARRLGKLEKFHCSSH